MALTQKMLKALGVDDEDKREQILDEHQATLKEIREERDSLREKAAEADRLRKELEEASKDGEWKSKYEAEHKALEDYRTEVEAERQKAEVARAYREQVLVKAGIDPKRVDSVMRLCDLSGVELEDGKVKGADELVKSAANEWADFVVRKRTKGADVADPPEGDKGKPGPSDIAKQVIRDRQSRLYGNKVEGGDE